MSEWESEENAKFSRDHQRHEKCRDGEFKTRIQIAGILRIQREVQEGPFTEGKQKESLCKI
ncbi:hypothetical protein LEMLEM_LOCUS4687 [Lemmus lemmus]